MMGRERLRVALAPVLASLLLIMTVAGLGYRTVSLWQPPGRWSSMDDFRNTAYYAPLAFRSGVNPYDRDAYLAAYPVHAFPAYSPLTLVAYAPFSVLPLRVAEVLYFLAMVGMATILAFSCLRFCDVRTTYVRVVLLATLVLLSRPGNMTVILGQTTFQLVIASLVALQFATTRPMVAGLALLLATFKPTFGIPLAILMLCRGDYRAVAIAAVAGGVAMVPAVGYLASRSGGFEAFVGSVVATLASHGENPTSNLATAWARIDLAFGISRGLDVIPSREVQYGIGLAVLLVVGVLVRRLSYVEKPARADSLSGALICFAILACIYHTAYDALLLSVAGGAACLSRREPWQSIPPQGRWMLIAAVFVLFTNYLATIVTMKWLGLGPSGQRLVTLINPLAVLLGLSACVWSVRHVVTCAPHWDATRS